ncbi:MAG: hypothetical protein HYR63_21320 [Proteobacteria bacterium]|nr:hypothetical protein [Pseudomonadota bacterium]MBI3500095.1 hypothetical protein [Pseudomonadota bacterium]
MYFLEPILDWAARSSNRIAHTIERQLAAIGASSVTIFGTACFLVIVVVTLITGFRTQLPDWLLENATWLMLSGRQKAELTLDYLLRWGLDDVVWHLLVGAVLLGGGLYSALLLMGQFKQWVKVRDWQRQLAAGRAVPVPRIPLKRSLKITIPAPGGHMHRYEMFVDLVLVNYSDVQPVIAGFSTLLPDLANVAKAVIQGSFTQVSGEDMARALSHAARRVSDKRVARVELRATAYSLVDEAGKVLYTQAPQDGAQPAQTPQAAEAA